MSVSAQKKLGLAVALVFVLECLIVYALRDRAGESNAQPAPAPAFDLAVLEPGTSSPAAGDGRITLRELRGTPVVLNVWASWCEACRVETPLLQDTWAHTDGVVFLGVASKDNSENARAFLRANDVTYPVVNDPDTATSDRYGAKWLPTTFFINARGEIVDEVVGQVSAEQLEAGIRAARAEM